MASSRLEIEKLYEEGMQADRAKSHDKAVTIFRRVMELAPHTEYYISSRYNIACNLMTASMKAGKDYSGEAILLWREGANEGHHKSMYYLAVVLERQKNAEALNFYIQAAKLGNDDARRALTDLGLVEIFLR